MGLVAEALGTTAGEEEPWTDAEAQVAFSDVINVIVEVETQIHADGETE